MDVIFVLLKIIFIAKLFHNGNKIKLKLLNDKIERKSSNQKFIIWKKRMNYGGRFVIFRVDTCTFAYIFASHKSTIEPYYIIFQCFKVKKIKLRF